MFFKVHCLRHCALVQKVRFFSMEAAKKAAGYTAIDRHIKVIYSSANSAKYGGLSGDICASAFDLTITIASGLVM